MQTSQFQSARAVTGAVPKRVTHDAYPQAIRTELGKTVTRCALKSAGSRGDGDPLYLHLLGRFVTRQPSGASGPT